MKKLKIVAYIVGIMWLVVVVQFVVNMSFRDEKRMEEAFARADVQRVSGSVRIVGTYEDRFMTEQDRKDVIAYIVRHLGIDSEIEYTKKEGKKTISCCSTLQNSHAKVELESIHVSDDTKKTSGKEYVYMNFTLQDHTDQISDYKKQIEDIFKKMEFTNYDTSVQMRGEYEGKLTKKEKEKIIDDAIDYMQGDIVNEHIKDDIATVYAYTPCIGSQVQVDKKQINMNLVFNYDEVHDRTSFYMASPILNEDY